MTSVGRHGSDRASAPLRAHVRESVTDYFEALNGHACSGLYEIVVAEVEQPLFEVVLHKAAGNLTRAAQMLGLNRATLRTKLRKYGLADGAKKKPRKPRARRRSAEAKHR